MDDDLLTDPGRFERGVQIWASKGVNVVNPRRWLVKSPGQVSGWDVDLGDDGKLSCSCPDFVQRHHVCKHVIAVQLELADGIKVTEKEPRDDAKPADIPDASTQDS
jgi:hypothetical protein